MEIISATIIEFVNIGKYSHNEALITFVTKTDLAETKYSFVTEDYDENCFEPSYTEIYMCNYPTTFMVYWWVTYSYYNNEQIQNSNVKLMNTIYGSSGIFWSLVRLNYIGHNIYTGINSNLSSKPTSIHGPAHKSDLN